MSPISDDVVGARIEVSCAALGFTPPPVMVRIRLLASSRGIWSLYVSPVSDITTSALVDWVLPAGPKRVEFGANGVIRADFAKVPDEWALTFAKVKMDLATLATDGSAVVAVRGTSAAVRQFAAAVKDGWSRGVVRIGPAVRQARLMTELQESALRFAVAEGYYRVPRPLNLHDLAAKLGITASSLSERLRNAEQRIVMRYVNEGVHEPLVLEPAPFAVALEDEMPLEN